MHSLCYDSGTNCLTGQAKKRGGEEMTFKELLKTKRWNYTTLARELGIKQNVVSKWGRKFCTPSPKRIKEIAQVLECTTDEVINALLA